MFWFNSTDYCTRVFLAGLDQKNLTSNNNFNTTLSLVAFELYGKVQFYTYFIISLNYSKFSIKLMKKHSYSELQNENELNSNRNVVFNRIQFDRNNKPHRPLIPSKNLKTQPSIQIYRKSLLKLVPPLPLFIKEPLCDYIFDSPQATPSSLPSLTPPPDQTPFLKFVSVNSANSNSVTKNNELANQSSQTVVEKEKHAVSYSSLSDSLNSSITCKKKTSQLLSADKLFFSLPDDPAAVSHTHQKKENMSMDICTYECPSPISSKPYNLVDQCLWWLGHGNGWTLTEYLNPACKIIEPTKKRNRGSRKAFTKSDRKSKREKEKRKET